MKSYNWLGTVSGGGEVHTRPGFKVVYGLNVWLYNRPLGEPYATLTIRRHMESWIGSRTILVYLYLVRVYYSSARAAWKGALSRAILGKGSWIAKELAVLGDVGSHSVLVPNQYHETDYGMYRRASSTFVGGVRTPPVTLLPVSSLVVTSFG
ncbi:hypothetical protein FIBSPDRAFT_897146 [Athelia psychrophila]|uniref:Uncharacterized protein n=1 Tax=Athelia psychrophila TaxID=1759441 RepID=A0A166CJ21_9AGAM|nr:hypothetical protein FIBSPDRAFT_897146 [Fibularhizoctonia sp. CBS 109695]